MMLVSEIARKLSEDDLSPCFKIRTTFPILRSYGRVLDDNDCEGMADKKRLDIMFCAF